jgi:16S rRNA (cytosine967-C5)-methyltransferase
LDWIIGQAAHFPLRKIDPRVLDILRLALYQVFFLDRVPESAAVNEAVKQAKAKYPGHIASFVNGLLRNICRHKEGVSYPNRKHGSDPLPFCLLLLPGLAGGKVDFRARRRHAEALLEAGNQTPPLVVRVNSI